MYRRYLATAGIALAALTVLTAAQSPSPAPPPQTADWPQWKGPDRTGVSRETGLLQQWPAAGPPLVWSISTLGAGYGSIAVKGERIFVQGSNGTSSSIYSVNRADGKVLWSRSLGPAPFNDMGPGPRSTPTVDDDRVYVLTENGDLACLRTVDGSVLWRRNILTDFRSQNIPWLVSESPLVDGNLLIVTPGGPNATVVALDKLSGKTIWTSRELSDEAGYASAIVADVHGVRTVMTLTANAGVGLRQSDGALMWRYQRAANDTANITTPVFADNNVFYTSSYGAGGALLGLTAQGGMVKAAEIYFTSEMQNHHGGLVLVDGYLYGFDDSILTCMEFATGKVMWRHRSVGKGSLTYADGRLYLLSEVYVIGLAQATPKGYVERGRFEVAEQGWPTYAHPVVSGGRLYIRNQTTLASYDVRAR